MANIEPPSALVAGVSDNTFEALTSFDLDTKSFGKVHSFQDLSDPQASGAWNPPVFGTNAHPSRISAKDIDLNEVFAGNPLCSSRFTVCLT